MRRPFLLTMMNLVLGPALDRIEQLAGRAVEPGLLARDETREIVEREHRRDGDGEAERRLDERLGDAGGDGGKPARPGRRDALKRADDAEHGAEQTDERRDRPDRREDGEATAQIGAEVA